MRKTKQFSNFKLLGLAIAICSSLTTAVWLMSLVVTNTSSFYFIFFLGVMRATLVLVILFISAIISIKLLILKRKRERAQ